MLLIYDLILGLSGTGTAAVNYGQSSRGTAPSQPVPQPSLPAVPAQAPASYASYSTYKPQTPAYTPYYDSVSASKTSATPNAAMATKTCTATTTTTYVPTYSPASTTGGGGGGGGGGTVGYPSYSQSNYASAANAYYKQMKDNKVSGDYLWGPCSVAIQVRSIQGVWGEVSFDPLI